MTDQLQCNGIAAQESTCSQDKLMSCHEQKHLVKLLHS